MSDADLLGYARARHVPVETSATQECRIEQNLWGRVVVWTGKAPSGTRPAARLDEAATVDVHFDHGVPTSVNGVPMSPAELVECLALIGSQHGIGQTIVSAQGSHMLYDAPAATILHAAAAVAGRSADADVRLKLADGEYTLLKPGDRHTLLVNA